MASYKPDVVDTTIRCASRVFALVLGKRIEARGEASLNEATVRFMLLNALSSATPTNILDMYLEYPYGAGTLEPKWMHT